MAHKKLTKRGRSYYVDKWNPAAKKFINKCALCGAEGYAPSIDQEGFVTEPGGRTNYVHAAIHAELTSILKPLELDELGRCEVCRKTMENK